MITGYYINNRLCWRTSRESPRYKHCIVGHVFIKLSASHFFVLFWERFLYKLKSLKKKKKKKEKFYSFCFKFSQQNHFVLLKQIFFCCWYFSRLFQCRVNLGLCTITDVRVSLNILASKEVVRILKLRTDQWIFKEK